MPEKDKIVIRGAREHNLKNIDLEIPRNKLIVITGLSGSGKSSLAFDTIYAEGQRRYVESLSAYARQFIGLMEKPDVDYIEGLSPAVSIEQRSAGKNPRSTVGTLTEIYDYLRLLFARIGKLYCYKCGRSIERQTIQQMVDQIMKLPENSKIQIFAPLIKGRKGEYKEIFKKIKKDGYVRVRVDKEIKNLDEEIMLDKNKKHSIDVIVDRLTVSEKNMKRLADSLETALSLGSGVVLVSIVDGNEIFFSEKFACIKCNISYEEPSPRMFSFNSPYGACPKCSGLGLEMELDPSLIVPNEDLSINEGAIVPWGNSVAEWYAHQIRALANYYGFDLDLPFKKIPEEAKKVLLYGSGAKEFKFNYKSPSERGEFKYINRFDGVIKNLSRRYRQTQSSYIRDWIESFMNFTVCSECSGKRLKKESLAIRIGKYNISDVTAMTVKEARKFFDNIELSQKEFDIAKQILKEVKERLQFMSNVGLDYLTLDRSTGSLSGGEAQRIRLATQIGSQLVGVLYILDEPSIGLHQRDNKKLINTLIKLRDIGNTVLVVEHDRETIESADYIVDLGPGAGENGGRVVVCGELKKVIDEKKSITGDYLARRRFIDIPDKRRKGSGKLLILEGARGNNLKNITLKIPLGTFTCITGVSGSGKSTLINETLYRILARIFYHSKVSPLEYKGIKGVEYVDKVINIDQSPIGRTPRSNPATYTGVFTYIRDLFALLPEAKIRGYKPGRFSFNVKGGRCEACEGDGIITIEMHFLPNVYITCDICKGKRYNRETLEVKYKGKSIADVLDMTVSEALIFLENIPKIKRKLQTIYDVGLGYIRLGQPATTLSGGEAQRVKLSTELSKVGTGSTLYLLDEPTTGLHFEDIKMLLNVLRRLVEKGNTVVVIEHNIDVIKTADYIIDLGPEGGDEGGEVICEGTPEDICNINKSYTGKFIKKELAFFENLPSFKKESNMARLVV
jgi:excinuclease ABC subunit A